MLSIRYRPDAALGRHLDTQCSQRPRRTSVMRADSLSAWQPRRGRGGDGQALVEFSLILTPLLLILFSIIQLGFLFSSQLGLSTATRETARFGSTLVTTSSGQAVTNRGLVLTDMQTQKLPQYLIAFSLANLNGAAATPPSNVTYCYYANPGSPTTWSLRVVAQAEYRQVLMLPLVSNLLDGFDGTTDGKLRLGAREEMRVEGPLLKTLPTGFPAC